MLSVKGLADKFRILDFSTRRRTIVEDEEPVYDLIAEQSAMIEELASTRQCREAFLPYLRGLLELDELEMEDPEVISSQPRTCVAQGKKQRTRHLIKKLEELGE